MKGRNRGACEGSTRSDAGAAHETKKRFIRNDWVGVVAESVTSSLPAKALMGPREWVPHRRVMLSFSFQNVLTKFYGIYTPPSLTDRSWCILSQLF